MLADTTHPPAVLANNVSMGSFVYDASSQRNALVQVNLGITRNNETVSLYHEVHVDNTP
jgi:MSHA biogenesis protein MshO